MPAPPHTLLLFQEAPCESQEADSDRNASFRVKLASAVDRQPGNKNIPVMGVLSGELICENKDDKIYRGYKPRTRPMIFPGFTLF